MKGDTSNMLDVGKFKLWLSEIDKVEKERADDSAAHKQGNAKLTKRHKELLKRAKADGINVEIFKLQLEKRSYLRKIEDLDAQIARLDRPMADVMGEQMDLFAKVMIPRACAEAAIRRWDEEQADDTADDLDSLTDDPVEDGPSEFDESPTA